MPGNRVGHPNYVASVAAVQSFARDHATVNDDNEEATNGRARTVVQGEA